MNTEQNFIDVNGTTTATSTLASRITSPTIPRGTGVGERVGSSLRFTRVDMRIHIAPASTTSANTSVRIIAVRNKEAGNASVSKILQTTTSFSSPINNLFKDLGLVLLYDEIFTVGTVTSGVGNVDIVRTFTGDNWHLQYTNANTDGSLTDVESGCISVFWMVDQVNTTAPVFTSTARYWYVDN